MKKALVIGTMILTSTSAFAANIIGTHQADMGSAVCLVNISEGGIDISDIRLLTIQSTKFLTTIKI